MATEKQRKAARKNVKSAQTLTELRREAAKLGIDGRSKMGKPQHPGGGSEAALALVVGRSRELAPRGVGGKF